MIKTRTYLMVAKVWAASLLTIITLTSISASVHAMTLPSAPIVAEACSIQPQGFISSKYIFTPWYKYLDGDRIDSKSKCHPKINSSDLKGDVIKIAVAIIELLVHVSGLISIGFFIVGAIQYAVSQGESTGINNAKTTMTNAIVGFIIVLFASGIIQFVGTTVRQK